MLLGISASAAILYKEYVNPDFLQRFCKIGKQVDCNQVLRSGGARLPGGVTLGEAGLVFFLSCLFFILYTPERYLFPMQCMVSVAFLVTLYSVYYQVGVLHKICNLCMVVNISIWSLMVVLWRPVSYTLSMEAGLPFLIFAGIFLLVAYGWSGIRKLLLLRGDGLRFKAFRSALVQDTELFRLMMDKQPALSMEYIDCALTYNNSASETILLWVTHPHCEHCARLHKIIHRMQDRLNIQLIFHVDPSDEKAFAVIQQITECYLNVGWKKSMHLLEKWYQNGELESPITPSSRTMDTLRKHSDLCRSLNIQGTPAVFINGRPYPDIYQFEDLEYLL
ncbi:MAG: hypothetical protein LIP08_01375 [Bacteroides sp.]|nr:hypothetical protein [Bacteroides sp.]